MDKTVHIGWSEVSITPDKPIYLSGQFYERISQFVETPITVTAMAIEACGDQAVICSADLTHIDPYLIDGVRANIKKTDIGLDPAKIIIRIKLDRNLLPVTRGQNQIQANTYAMGFGFISQKFSRRK